jgi:hypothetical protein
MKKLSLVVYFPDHTAWSLYKLRTSLQSLDQTLQQLAYPGKIDYIISTPDPGLAKELGSLTLPHLELSFSPNLNSLFPEIVGEYFLAVEADVVFDTPHLQLLLDTIEGNYNNLFNPEVILFVIPYFLLQANNSLTESSLEDWRRQLVFGGSRLPNYELRIGVPIQHATLAHRSLWHAWYSSKSEALLSDLNLLLTSPSSAQVEHPIIVTHSLGLALYRLPASPHSLSPPRSLNDTLSLSDQTQEQSDHCAKVHDLYQVVNTRGFTRYHDEDLAQCYLKEFASLFPILARLNEAHALRQSLVVSSSPSPLTATFSPSNRGQLVWVCPKIQGMPRAFLYSLEVAQLISQYLKSMYEGRIINIDYAIELARLPQFSPYPGKYDMCYFDMDTTWQLLVMNRSYSLASLFHDRTIIIFRLMDHLSLRQALSILGLNEEPENLFKMNDWYVLYPFEPTSI